MRIFISYGHDRTAFVRLLAEYLTGLGHQVWMDFQKIYSGADWRSAITEGILRSDAVLVILSSHSLRKESVCLDEIKISVLCNRNIIRPILTETGLEEKIPVTIRGTQYFDFTDMESVWKDTAERTRKLEQIRDELVRIQNDPYPAQMETLLAALRPSQKKGSFMQTIEKPYSERKWLEELILQEVDKDGNLPILLIGFPGSGKSCFCSRFYREHACAVSLLLLKWGDYAANNTNMVVRTIACQIASRIASYRNRLLWLLSNYHASLESLSEAELFELLIVEPFAYEIDGSHENLIVLIDGMDEATENEDSLLSQIILEKAALLPKYVQFLVSTRNNPQVMRHFSGMRQIELTPHDDRVRTDIRNYLNERLPAGISGTMKRRLEESCDGSFLVANLLVQGILEGIIDINGAELIPKNIFAIYDSWMRRMVSSQEFEAEYYDVFSILAASSEPISAGLLMSILKWRRRKMVDFFLRFRQFLVEESADDGQKRIAFFHNSFRKWIDSEDADSYCVDSEEGIQLLANGLLALYEDGSLADTELLHLWEYLKKAKEFRKQDAVRRDDGYLERLLVYAVQISKKPSQYMEFQMAIRLAESICSEREDGAFVSGCRDVRIPLIKADDLFCSGDHFGNTEVLSRAISHILQKGTQEEAMKALYLFGTSSDLIGQRNQSRESFEKLLSIAETAGNLYYKNRALVGLAWNSHFTDVSKLDCYLRQLSSMRFESNLEEQIYKLLEARVLLSRGEISLALGMFSEVLPRCPKEVWGYGMLSIRSQMLMIEAVVACYDNEKYDLGIQYGNQLHEKLENRGTIAECYCASWVAMNCIANGLTEDAAAYLSHAEQICKGSNRSPRSQWITMHLKSVRAIYFAEIGEDEMALQYHRAVAEMAELCSDPWVMGDAYFSMICLYVNSGRADLQECETTVQKLHRVAKESQLPHLLFKSRVAEALFSEQLDAEQMLALEHQISENALPSTDMVFCAYLCVRISVRHGENQLGRLFADRIRQLVSKIAADNRNGRFGSRPLIQELRKEHIL